MIPKLCRHDQPRYDCRRCRRARRRTEGEAYTLDTPAASPTHAVMVRIQGGPWEIWSLGTRRACEDALFYPWDMPWRCEVALVELLPRRPEQRVILRLSHAAEGEREVSA